MENCKNTRIKSLVVNIMYRAQILILDEYRMIDINILKKVLRRFLATPRQPKYLNNPKYAHLQERNKEIYISSAWYKSHWSWDKFTSATKMMLQGKRYFTCALPYTLSIHHGLLTKEQIENERLEDDFDPIGFEMEMSAKFFGENQFSYYKLEDLSKNRSLLKAFYPQNNLDYSPTWKSSLPKVKGEIRIIGVDVALMKGAKNDNTIFSLIRLIPNGASYQRQLVYMEHANGQHSELQAIRLKQLYEDFEADKVVLDAQGAGMAVYDSCVKILYDKDRDKEYPAWTCFNDEKMAERCLSPDAEPVIYSMKVTQASLNHEIATSLREDLKKGKIKLLSQEIDAREHLNKQAWFKKLSEYDKMRFLMPYQQTTVLVNEMINLEYQVSDAGFIKVMEKGSARKDRYSSFAYANYLAKVLEQDLLKVTRKSNLGNYMFYN